MRLRSPAFRRRSSSGRSWSAYLPSPSSAAAPSAAHGAASSPPTSSSSRTTATSPPSPLVSGFQHGGSMYQDILALNRRATDPAAQLIPINRLDDASLIPHASCDGLLILSIQCFYFSICNPVTREEAPLDLVCGFTFLGFYPHRPTGEYRLLLYRGAKLMFEDLIPGPRDAYYVYALGSGLPRRIGSPSSSERPLIGCAPVLFRGCLHWNPGQHKSGRGVIAVFNTETESFQLMRAPTLGNRNYGFGVYTLFEMDGTLGMFSCNDGDLQCIDIWVLQDYEKEVWKLRYQVELPMSEIMHKFDASLRWRAMAVYEEGSIVVLVHGDRWLLHVDTEGKLQASFHRDGQSLMPSSEMIKQSLVRHAFFPKLNDYEVNGLTFI